MHRLAAFDNLFNVFFKITTRVFHMDITLVNWLLIAHIPRCCIKCCIKRNNHSCHCSNCHLLQRGLQSPRRDQLLLMHLQSQIIADLGNEWMADGRGEDGEGTEPLNGLIYCMARYWLTTFHRPPLSVVSVTPCRRAVSHWCGLITHGLTQIATCVMAAEHVQSNALPASTGSCLAVTYITLHLPIFRYFRHSLMPSQCFKTESTTLIPRVSLSVLRRSRVHVPPTFYPRDP